MKYIKTLVISLALTGIKKITIQVLTPNLENTLISQIARNNPANSTNIKTTFK